MDRDNSSKFRDNPTAKSMEAPANWIGTCLFCVKSIHKGDAKGCKVLKREDVDALLELTQLKSGKVYEKLKEKDEIFAHESCSPETVMASTKNSRNFFECRNFFPRDNFACAVFDNVDVGSGPYIHTHVFHAMGGIMPGRKTPLKE
ncbi:hypothetical protein QAD02_002371 [Eretmocerus hayati]|uniref:Uncharacterized protein n=1 Tax=Eretmocerus hayati TaxID=131215 RepID=A0ACC2NLL5_9HYME|nr:hypothetical protein QAD02_002371 [Eretmocerus hayati]